MDTPQTLPPRSAFDVDTEAVILPRLIPVVFGIMFCFCTCYALARGPAPATSPAAANQETSTEEEQPLEKRIADIESKLVIRKVLKVVKKETDDTVEEEEGGHEDGEQGASGWMEASGRLYSNIRSSFYASGSNQHHRVEFSAPLNAHGLTQDDETDNLGDIERGEATQIGDECGTDACNHGCTCGRPVCDVVAAETRAPNDKNEARRSSLHQKQQTPTLLRKLSSSLGLSHHHHHDHDHPTTCDICLTDYEVGDEVAWSKNDACRHAFHKECIRDWLLRRPDCPLCRRNYLVDTSKEAQE